MGTPLSKRGSFKGPHLLGGVAGKKGGDFFQGELQYSHKNKLKSEIFNDEKVYKQKFFSVITSNSNWEILPKN